MTDSRREDDKAVEAREMAERGLHEQAMGHNAEADRLLTRVTPGPDRQSGR